MGTAFSRQIAEALKRELPETPQALYAELQTLTAAWKTTPADQRPELEARIRAIGQRYQALTGDPLPRLTAEPPKAPPVDPARPLTWATDPLRKRRV